MYKFCPFNIILFNPLKMNYKQKKIITLDKSLRAEILTGLVEHNKIKLVGLGTFEIKEVSARPGRNPLTGKIMEFRAYKKIKFKATKKLKVAVCL